MKKLIIATALSLSLGIIMPAEINAATSPSTSQAAPKKAAKKTGAKKTATAKKYVPMSIGDCYIGEAMYYQSEPVWMELTLYPNGTCEWKANGKTSKGTFSGTITGGKYTVKVSVPEVGNYTFKGNKEHWDFEGPRESISLSLEH